jgi:hypothetical protein
MWPLSLWLLVIEVEAGLFCLLGDHRNEMNEIHEDLDYVIKFS